MVESRLLLVALAELSEPGAEASDRALLDGAEGVTPVLVPGALGSAPSLLISRLGPTHWKGIESVFTQTRSPDHALSKPVHGQEPWDSPRVPGFIRMHPRALRGGLAPSNGRPNLSQQPWVSLSLWG